MVMLSSNMKSKKGLSAVVAVMILVLLVLAGIGILWGVLKKTVDEGLDEAKSCYDIIGKTGVNSEYTCYNPIEDRMNVSIEIGDIKIDSLFIVLGYEESALSFELTNEPIEIDGLLNYDGSGLIKLPNKNAGATYIATNIIEMPLQIELAPMINDNLCTGETFTNIGVCT